MSARVRNAVATLTVLAVVLGLEAFGLRSGTLGLVLIGLVAAVAVAVVAFKVDLQWAGVGMACACSFTLTWNGWYVGPVRPGDALVLLTLLCFLLAHPNGAFRTPPWWVKLAAILIILVAVLQIYFPPDPVYLSSRIALDATGQPLAPKSSLIGANIGVAFKFVVAVAAIPMAFAGAALVDRRAVRWLATAFAAGAGLSGAAATVDHFGANVARLITRVPNAASRQAGFTTHPNFLAAGLTLAVPLAFWLMLSQRRYERILGWASMVSLLGGVYASGSRGGAVCVVLALALCVVLHERTRGHAPTIAIASLIVAGLVAVFVPGIGAQVLRVTRLSGGVATEGSDSVRHIVGAQGMADFYHSPIKGIGLQASTDASQVYIQELASGGLILFIAMATYLLGAIVTAFRNMRRFPLAASLLASLLVTLALNIFEADLTDRFYYVPAAILIALVHTAGDDGGSPAESADEQPALAHG